MEFTSIIASIFITGLAIYLIVNPLLQKKSELEIVNGDGSNSTSVINDSTPEIIEEASEGSNLKHLYVTINEIEMDYNMGKLSKEDYLELRKRYEVLIASKLN